MPFRGIRRTVLPFGRMINRKGRPRSNLLITNHGESLGLRYGKLLSCVRIRKVGGEEQITFSDKIHPTHIGEGEHGTVFRLFPREESTFLKDKGQGIKMVLPSMVLKVYHIDNVKMGKPDGFTQFYANTVIFNWLKARPKKGFAIVPLDNLFVSDRITVRRFINAPTFEEARLALLDPKSTEPLGEALSNAQILDFLAKRKITLYDVDSAEKKLFDLLYEGKKTNFGTRFNIEIDPIWRNYFVAGKTKSGEIAASVIDQGKVPIPKIGRLLRKGKIAL